MIDFHHQLCSFIHQHFLLTQSHVYFLPQLFRCRPLFPLQESLFQAHFLPLYASLHHLHRQLRNSQIATAKQENKSHLHPPWYQLHLAEKRHLHHLHLNSYQAHFLLPSAHHPSPHLLHQSKNFRIASAKWENHNHPHHPHLPWYQLHLAD